MHPKLTNSDHWGGCLENVHTAARSRIGGGVRLSSLIVDSPGWARPFSGRVDASGSCVWHSSARFFSLCSPLHLVYSLENRGCALTALTWLVPPQMVSLHCCVRCDLLRELSSPHVAWSQVPDLRRGWTGLNLCSAVGPSPPLLDAACACLWWGDAGADLTARLLSPES